MKIFVSHALADKELLASVKRTLEPHGISLLIAEHFQDIRRTITDKIENMIMSCDVALILLTENGFNSIFVQQEIGYIKSLKKPFLQIIQKGIESKITGFTFGRDYICYEPNEPQKALEKMSSVLIKHWKQLEQRKIAARAFSQRQLEAARVENLRKANEAKIGIGIFAGLLILAVAASE